MKNLVWLLILIGCTAKASPSLKTEYSARGVGGGGAMAAFSISPYSDLRFVGTDMGTLFRSPDLGTTWIPVAHDQVRFNSDLNVAGEVGFSSDPKVTFFADAGKNPKRSKDAGVTWSSISIPLEAEERIRYWVGDPKDPKVILCATTEGLLRSSDQGNTWKRISDIDGFSSGTSWLSKKIFHATREEIFVSNDQGLTFQSWYAPPGGLKTFAAGEDAKGVTWAYIDNNGKQACSWAPKAKDANDEQKAKTVDECGYVSVQHASSADAKPDFKRTNQEAGRYLKMADNDSQTIYITGGDWVRQYGSKIWVSKDAGKTFKLRYQTYDWDQRPYRPWPKDKLEYSAVGLDVGWDDNVPFSFTVNRRHSNEAGETGHYFLHTTTDSGEHWKAPFTQFADEGDRLKGKHWKSTGLEVTSALRMKFHPKNPHLAYVSLADIGGYVTEDGGKTFRISKAKYNTNYDYAFNPSKPDVVYAASGNRHDFPINIQNPIQGEGGIFFSNDRGRTWKRLTPDNTEFNRQFLSVAYDPIHHTIYGGTQGAGVARSTDDGKTWAYFNLGFDPGDRVITQIEVDPKDGTAYALLTGNAPEFRNRDETGIYRLTPKDGEKWELLRKTVVRPNDLDDATPLWQFPTAFAVNFSNGDRKELWLTDMELKGAWMASGVWKSTDGGDTWKRMTQFTHPTAVSLIPPKTVQVSGSYEIGGKWGKGGALSSVDGGVTWKKNEKFPLLANLFGFTPDPNDSKKGFFLFFGGGILYGPIQ